LTLQLIIPGLQRSSGKKTLLKVLQICNKAPFPANDGSSIAIYNMARGLIENGVDLHLLTINTKKHFKADQGVPENFRKMAHYTSVYQNTNPGPLGALSNLLSGDSYFVSRFHFKAFERKLITLLRTEHFDVVQIEGLFMAAYIDVIRKNSKAKVVLRAHNVEHLIWQRHLANKPWSPRNMYLRVQNKRLRDFEMRVLSKVDAIIPITIADEREFLEKGDKVAWLGIGSGLNCLMLGLEW
jgi:hypothetical protein